MNQTIEYYNKNAAEFCDKHDSVRLGAFYEAMRREFSKGAKLIEIGCGSGRDAALAFKEGFDVIALDGSENLLKEIPKRHPELSGRLYFAILPEKLKFNDNHFDGFYSVACLMHLSEKDLKETLIELKRITKLAGKGLVSVPACRADVTDEGVDIHNRVFHLRTLEEWTRIFNECGFTATASEPEPDKLGREGVLWRTFTLIKN